MLHLSDETAVRVSRALEETQKKIGTGLAILSRIEDDEYLVLSASPSGAIPDGSVFSVEKTYCSMMLANGGLLAISEMSTSQYRTHPCYGEFGLETYIGAPVVIDGAVFGTVNFSSSDAREKAWSAEEKVWVEEALLVITAAIQEELEERTKITANLS